MTRAVRQVSAAAAPALAAIHRAAFPAASAWDAAAIARLAALPGVIVLTDGSASPRGFIMMRIAGGESEILTLAVRPEVQRQGVARTLLRAGLARAIASGAGACFLEVGEGNAAARALYAGFGFVETGRRRAYYAPTQAQRGREDALVLRWSREVAETARQN